MFKTTYKGVVAQKFVLGNLNYPTGNVEQWARSHTHKKKKNPRYDGI